MRITFYSYRERLYKYGLTTFLESKIRGVLVETFKIIEFLFMVVIF